MTLKVHSIFSTFQGEGPFAGVPAIFIRFSDCNLACTFCDTDFKSFTEKSETDIITEVNILAGASIKLIVITGGEPFLQPIETLCEMLINIGYKVQIETNGILYRPIPRDVTIVCSPKNNGQKFYTIHPNIFSHAIAIKFLVSEKIKGYHNIPEIGQTAFSIPVYVQPIDEYDAEKNRDNLNLAMKLARENNYRLSLQLHKFIGIE